MSTTKSTPGRWRLEEGQPDDHGEDGGGGFTICMGDRERTGGGRYIHAAGYAEGMYPEDKEYPEAEANARLMASAPELLAALKQTALSLEIAIRAVLDVGLFDSPAEYESAVNSNKGLMAARAAIRKAEGQ